MEAKPDRIMRTKALASTSRLQISLFFTTAGIRAACQRVLQNCCLAIGKVYLPFIIGPMQDIIQQRK